MIPSINRFTMLRYRQQSQQGQSIAEVSLLIALVAIICIGSLGLLSGTVQDALASLSEDSKALSLKPFTDNPAPQADNTGNAPAGNNQQAGTPASAPAAAQTEGGMGLTLANGERLQFNQYPNNLAQHIETSGANGATLALISTLEDVIKQSEQNGTLTKDEANGLRAMAEQGYAIARMQADIEEMVKKGIDTQASESIRWEIGYNPNANTEGSLITAFRDLHATAQKNGALKDPVLSQTVGILANQIINIASGVENAACYNQVFDSMEDFGNAVVDEMYERDHFLGTNTKQTLLDLGASVVTQQNSQAICQAGGGAQDNCRS